MQVAGRLRMRDAPCIDTCHTSALSPREAWSLRLLSVTTLSGMAVAGYLLSLHARIAGDPARGLCTFTETISCDKVLASPYAEIGGVPVALIGLMGFAILCLLAAWRLWVPERSPRNLPAVLALGAGLGLCFELGMTWVEVFIIQALCPYCLTALGLIGSTFVAALWAWQAARSRAVRGRR
jgi:uncharacterized membrane protein